MAQRILPITDKDINSDTELTRALPVITLAVRTGSGQTAIGYISELNRTHTRDVTRLYQLEPYTGNNDYKTLRETHNTYFPGEAVEVVPGRVSDETLELTRYALYTSTLFEAFMRANGSGDNNDKDIKDVNATGSQNEFRYVNTLQQVRPVNVYEYYISPVSKNILWGIVYYDCWFTNMGRRVGVTGDTVISEQATLQVTRTRPWTGK